MRNIAFDEKISTKIRDNFYYFIEEGYSMEEAFKNILYKFEENKSEYPQIIMSIFSMQNRFKEYVLSVMNGNNELLCRTKILEKNKLHFNIYKNSLNYYKMSTYIFTPGYIKIECAVAHMVKIIQKNKYDLNTSRVYDSIKIIVNDLKNKLNDNDEIDMNSKSSDISSVFNIFNTEVSFSDEELDQLIDGTYLKKHKF